MAEPLTRSRLDEIRERLADGRFEGYPECWDTDPVELQQIARELLAEVERLKATFSQRPVLGGASGGGATCPVCGREAWQEHELGCRFRR
jgi:hypothetical protein